MFKKSLVFIFFVSQCAYGSNYSNFTVTTSPSKIFQTNKNRGAWILHNNGINTIFIAIDSNVSSANGIPVLPDEKMLEDGANSWKGDVYAVTATGTADIRTLEWGQNEAGQ